MLRIGVTIGIKEDKIEERAQIYQVEFSVNDTNYIYIGLDTKNDPDSKLWKNDQSNSEANEDFEKWLDLIETYQIGKKHAF